MTSRSTARPASSVRLGRRRVCLPASQPLVSGRGEGTERGRGRDSLLVNEDWG